MSHEELNPYHRLLGRVIVLLMICHASLYLNFYIQNGLLLKRIKDWDVILGLSAITLSLLLFTTAFAQIRNYSYRLFFYLHVTLSMALLPILFLHVTYLRVYTLEALAAYIVLILQRNYFQAPANATVTRLPPTNLLSISVPLTKSLRLKRYVPGQHIYISFPSLPQKLRLNPFTIANLPSQDGKIHLFARSLSGSTAMLADLATRVQPTPLIFEGPYGAASYFPDLSTFDRILLVAGGVGATFTLPIYTSLLKATNGQAGKVRSVWTVKYPADASWGVEMLRREFDELPGGFELHVSGGPAPVKGGSVKDGAEVDEIELQERTGLLNEEASSDEALEGSADANIMKRGRANLQSVVDEVFSHDASDAVAVLVCGPQGMGVSVRKEVGKWVGRGRDVFWHAEEFGW